MQYLKIMGTTTITMATLLMMTGLSWNTVMMMVTGLLMIITVVS